MTVSSSLAEPTFIDRVRARAARRPRRIVFPESADLRVRTAVEMLARERIVEPVVLLDPAAPDTHAAVEALGVETIDPVRDTRRKRTLADLLERRAKKGLTEDAAAEYASHPRFVAGALGGRGMALGRSPRTPGRPHRCAGGGQSGRRARAPSSRALGRAGPRAPRPG